MPVDCMVNADATIHLECRPHQLVTTVMGSGVDPTSAAAMPLGSRPWQLAVQDLAKLREVQADDETVAPAPAALSAAQTWVQDRLNNAHGLPLADCVITSSVGPNGEVDVSIHQIANGEWTSEMEEHHFSASGQRTVRSFRGGKLVLTRANA